MADTACHPLPVGKGRMVSGLRLRLKRHRVFLLHVLAGVLLVTALLLGGQEVVRRSAALARQEAERRVLLGATSVAQLVQRQFEGFESIFDLLRAAQLARTQGVVPAALESQLRRFAEERRFGIVQLAVFGAEGEPLWFTMSRSKAINVADRDYFRAQRDGHDGLFVSEPLFGRITGGRRMVVSRRLELEPGGPFLIAAILVDPALFAASFAEVLASPSQLVGLFRQDGRLVAVSPAGTAALERGYSTRERPGPDGTAVRVAFAAISQDERILGYRAVAGQPLFIGLSSPLQAELAEHHRFAGLVRLLLVVAGAVILLGLALSFMLTTRRRQEAESARARAERAALERQQAAIEAMLDCVPGAVSLFRLTPEGFAGEDYLSAGAARLLGMPLAAVRIRGGMATQAEPPFIPAEIASLHAGLADKGEAVLERQFRRASGEPVWLRCSTRLLGREGDALQAVGLLTDIGPERAAQAAAIASARMATLGELSAGILHEFRQPLSIIRLASDASRGILQRRPPDMAERLDVRMTRIAAMVERTEEIADQLRLFARTEEAELAAVRLPDAVAGARLLAGAALKQAGIGLELDMPRSLPPVRGKRALLEQVLTNLLINARDALADRRQGGGLIRIAAEASATEVRVRVIDNGPGIPPEVLPRLFEAFFTTKPPGAGTGLGLSVCDGILRKLGGGITAANAPDGGAVFTLHLPRAG